MSGYNNYQQIIKNNLRLQPSDWSFKSNSHYNEILEHVYMNKGIEYLSEIMTKYSNIFITHKQFLIELCHKNDLYGKPHKHNFNNFTTCSGTNLRYILHTLLILTYIKEMLLDDINFVEIGGGYGGLAFFIHNLAPIFNIKIKSYTMFDLPEATVLQKTYLNLFNINIDIGQLDKCSNLSKDSFLISNYAYSEISRDFQNKYTEEVLNKYITYGFLTWNSPDIHNFINKDIIKIPETPRTGQWNYYIYIKPFLS